MCMNYNLSLEDAIEMSKRLAGKVAEQFSPKLIVGILSGGFLPAVEIAKIFGVPVEFIRLNRYYEDVVVLTHPLEMDLRGLDVLLVDDIYEYGRTMKMAKQHLQDKNPQNIKVAVLRYAGVFDKDPNAPDFFELHPAAALFPWRAPDHIAFPDYKAYLIEASKVTELGAVVRLHLSI